MNLISNGFCPVAEFFDELKSKKKVEYERVIKKLERLQRCYSLETLKQNQFLGKVINEDFWELRISAGIEVRLLGVIKNNTKLEIFKAVHGFHKKDQRIKKRHIDLARERLKN